MTEHATPPPDNTGDNEHHLSRLGKLMKRHPVIFALSFEGALALSLALLFGLGPRLSIKFDVDALLVSALATASLVAAALAPMQTRLEWVKALRRIVEDHLLPLLRDAGLVAVNVRR